MRRSFFAFLIAFSLGPLSVTTLRAQGRCPEGEYRASPANVPGPAYCAPIPHDLQGHPVTPPMTATHWGAIATEADLFSFGTAHDRPTKQAAEQDALDKCRQHGGSPCAATIAYGNGCAALVTSDLGFQAAADVTLSRARQAAMRSCIKAGGNDCHLAYSDCSPVQ